MGITLLKKYIYKKLSGMSMARHARSFFPAKNSALSAVRKANLGSQIGVSSPFYEVVSHAGVLQLNSARLFSYRGDFRDLRIGNDFMNLKLSRFGQDELELVKKGEGECCKPVDPSRDTLILGSSILMNYFHWMSDVLGDFYFVKEVGFDPFGFKAIAVPAVDKDWQKEVVAMLGLRSVISYKDLCGSKVPVTIPIRIKGRVNPLPVWQARAIEQVLNVTDLGGGATDATSVLYVSRASATRRRLVDEAALLDELARVDVECVDLAGLSVKEQALLFRDAQVVVGIHGAGLTNLAFCREGAQVVELFPPRKKTACFANFAYEKKLVYRALWGCERITGMGAGLEDFRLGSQGIQDVIETISRYLDGLKG